MARNNMFYGCYGHEDAGSISNVLMDCHVEGSRTCDFDCDGDACSVQLPEERNWIWNENVAPLGSVRVRRCLLRATNSSLKFPDVFVVFVHIRHPFWKKTSLRRTEYCIHAICHKGLDKCVVSSPTLGYTEVTPFLFPFQFAQEPSYDISFESPY